jgi:hypothetical protein
MMPLIRPWSADESEKLKAMADNAFAFDDTAKAEELVLDGYVQKDGDLYQLTPKGEKSLLDNGVSA